MMTFGELQALVAESTGERTSPFYRNLYGMKPGNPSLRIRTMEEWESLPFFSKDDLMRTTLPQRSFPPWSEIDAILASSGTSGRSPVFSPWSLNDGYEYRWQYHDFSKATLSSMPTPQQQAWIIKRHSPGRLIVLDPKHPRASARLAKAAGVDSMFLILHHLPPLAKEMERLGITEQIRFIELAGESCSRTFFRYIQKTFPNAIVVSIYGSTDVEASPIGIVCQPITGKEPLEVFHGRENFYLEIANTDSGKIESIKPGVEGDLIITAYAKPHASFPLIRYRIGDTVRVVEERCTVHGTWSFEILGRTEMDFVKVPGGVLRADEVARILRGLSGRVKSDMFEIHQYERETPRGVLQEFILHVETGPGTDYDALAKEIEHLLRTGPTFTYAQGVAEGRYLPLRCVPLDTRPAQAKHKRIIRH